jgi:putative ABC transport system ATP-binding protein
MTIRLVDVDLQLGSGAQTVTALDHVNLEVGAGELVCILGPSGSGKSSLLAVAGLLMRPSAGRVLIDEVEVTAANERGRARVRSEQIGFVFQFDNLLAPLTAVEQLLIVDHIRGTLAPESRDRAAALLGELGVGQLADRRPHQMSGGERQRVGIARALMASPSVLLADEPTASLDHARSIEIARLLAEETRRHGIATILVTHDPALVEWADRVLHMQDGALLTAAPDAHGGAGDRAAD